MAMRYGFVTSGSGYSINAPAENIRRDFRLLPDLLSLESHNVKGGTAPAGII